MRALAAEGLRFGYPGRDPIFEELSLTVAPGRVTVLLGPNGSGKSTLLALLLGYLFPDAGRVEVLGREVKEYQRRELGRILAFVSQSGTLPFNYPVFEYILLGRTARISRLGLPGEEDRAAALRAAGKAGIDELLERNVQELSAGEMQLVSIARALAQEPRILMLDEPTSHLDPAHAMKIFTLLRTLSRQGLTVLFTTHDPLHARQVADEAILLQQGKLLYSGAAGEGLTAPRLSELYGVAFSEIRQGDLAVPLATLPVGNDGSGARE